MSSSTKKVSTYICPYCSKLLGSKQSLGRHTDKTCKNKPNLDQDPDVAAALKELEALKLGKAKAELLARIAADMEEFKAAPKVDPRSVSLDPVDIAEGSARLRAYHDEQARLESEASHQASSERMRAQEERLTRMTAEVAEMRANRDITAAVKLKAIASLEA